MSHAILSEKIVAYQTQDSAAYPYYVHRPENLSDHPKIVVLVHGITRNAAEHCTSFVKKCACENTFVIAPLFTKTRFKYFQQLKQNAQGEKPADALNTILGDVSTRQGIDTGRMVLCGYSGGAQFAHRFAMMYPQRIHKLILTAAGWYTFPDPAAPYPEGLHLGEQALGQGLNPRELLRFPIEVFVGAKDNRRDGMLNKKHSIDLRQGRDRLARARNWVIAMNALAIGDEIEPTIRLTVIPNAGHEFSANFRSADYLNALKGAVGV